MYAESLIILKTTLALLKIAYFDYPSVQISNTTTMHRWLLDTHTYTRYKLIITTLFSVKLYRFCERIHVTEVVVMFLPKCWAIGTVCVEWPGRRFSRPHIAVLSADRTTGPTMPCGRRLIAINYSRCQHCHLDLNSGTFFYPVQYVREYCQFLNYR